MNYSPVDIARQYLFVREAGPNTGLRVEAIQHWSNGSTGDSWCCEFVTMVLDICFQGDAPVPRLGACQDVYDMAKQKGWLTDSPLAGDLYLFVNGDDHAHHIGIVTADGAETGIAGNTSADGTSSNGDRVAEHQISTNPATVKYVQYPR